MKTPQQLLAAAKTLPLRSNLEDHYETVATLRTKGLTWREVAKWLGENGIETDHAKVFRMFSRLESERSFTVPSAEQYQQALESLRRKDKLNASALAMLHHHHTAHNRTVTYTALAQAAATASVQPGAEAGSPNHRAANSIYGKLGRLLGEAIDAHFRFAPADDKGTPFYSSAIGAPNPWKPDGGHFQLVMHHELAKALDELGWANDLSKESA